MTTWHTVFRRWLAERPALDRIEFANVSPGPRSRQGGYEYTGPVVVITRTEDQDGSHHVRAR